MTEVGGFPKFGAPYWGPDYKRTLLFGVYPRCPLFSTTPQVYSGDFEDPNLSFPEARCSAQPPSSGDDRPRKPATAPTPEPCRIPKTLNPIRGQPKGNRKRNQPSTVAYMDFPDRTRNKNTHPYGDRIREKGRDYSNPLNPTPDVRTFSTKADGSWPS